MKTNQGDLFFLVGICVGIASHFDALLLDPTLCVFILWNRSFAFLHGTVLFGGLYGPKLWGPFLIMHCATLDSHNRFSLFLVVVFVIHFFPHVFIPSFFIPLIAEPSEEDSKPFWRISYISNFVDINNNLKSQPSKLIISCSKYKISLTFFCERWKNKLHH